MLVAGPRVREDRGNAQLDVSTSPRRTIRFEAPAVREHAVRVHLRHPLRRLLRALSPRRPREHLDEKLQALRGEPSDVVADIGDFPLQKPEATAWVQKTMTLAVDYGTQRRQRRAQRHH